MKVKELIERLMQYGEEKEIVVILPNSDHYCITSIETDHTEEHGLLWVDVEYEGHCDGC